MVIIRSSLIAIIIVTVTTLLVWASYADSSSPGLAAYYDRKMLLCGDTAYEWEDVDRPQLVATQVRQIGVGRDASYILTNDGDLMTWTDASVEKIKILDRVNWFAAGRTGVFAARMDGALVYLARPKSWFGEGDVADYKLIARKAISASIGDSADYFVHGDGTLFVKGLAHRGQYGNGELEPSDHFIPVAHNVIAVKAHTGHAILLKRDGTVMGTGGNIYGPLGKHGIGDKAVSWGEIFKGAKAIATGSSHSLAIKVNNTLWHWGRDIGLEPTKILDDVVAAAADQRGSIALKTDNTLWQWQRGKQPLQHFQCP